MTYETDEIIINCLVNTLIVLTLVGFSKYHEEYLPNSMTPEFKTKFGQITYHVTMILIASDVASRLYREGHKEHQADWSPTFFVLFPIALLSFFLRKK